MNLTTDRTRTRRSGGSGRGLNGPIRKASAGMGVALALLLVMELVLRLVLGPPPPPVQVYSGLQDRDTYFSSMDDWVVTEYQPARTRVPLQESGGRIAVLGGSSVHRGGPTSFQNEFPALLSSELGVTVYNLGSPAVDSHDLLKIVTELSDLPFDAFVIYSGHNDFGNTFFSERYKTWHGGLQAYLQAGLERTQTFCLIRSKLTPVVEGTQTRQHPDPDQDQAINEVQQQTTLRYYRQNLQRIAWLLEQRSQKLVLVTPASNLLQSPIGNTDPDATRLWQEGTSQVGTDPDQAARLLAQARDRDPIPMRAPSTVAPAVRAIAGSTGAVLVDALADLPREPGVDVPAQRLFADAVHLSEQGHQELAKLIATTLTEAIYGGGPEDGPR